MNRIPRLFASLLILAICLYRPLFAQNLEIRGTLALPGATAIDAVGGTAYVARPDNFAVVSVLDPADPALVGQTATGAGEIRALDAEGAYVYAAGAGDGLIIFSVSNPAQPALLTSFGVGSSAHGVAVRDTLVAVATPAYVTLVGVRDREHPNILTSFGRAASWVEFDPVRMQIHAGGATGAFSLDIRTTVSGDTNFSLILNEQYGTTLLSPLALTGRYVDVAQGATLVVLDSSDYGLEGQWQAPAAIRALAATTGKVFVGTSNGAVSYLIQTTGTPAFSAAATLPAAATGLAIAESGAQDLVVASHNDGVSVLAYDFSPVDPSAPALPAELSLTAFPNPFNSAVEVRLEAARPDIYRFALYDALGRELERRVIRLEHVLSLRLDFTNRSAGTYFVRLWGTTSSAQTRLIYLP